MDGLDYRIDKFIIVTCIIITLLAILIDLLTATNKHDSEETQGEASNNSDKEADDYSEIQ